MNALIKALLIASPILAVVLYYVMAQQSEIKADMHIQETAIERDWSEAMADMAASEATRDKYAARAEKADKKLAEAGKKQAEKAKKVDDFEKAFDSEMRKMETKNE